MRSRRDVQRQVPHHPDYSLQHAGLLPVRGDRWMLVRYEVGAEALQSFAEPLAVFLQGRDGPRSPYERAHLIHEQLSERLSVPLTEPHT